MTHLLLFLIAWPFGWVLGLMAAAPFMRGGEAGQLPAFTIPFALIAAFLFAFLPIGSANGRLKLMAILTLIMGVLSSLIIR